MLNLGLETIIVLLVLVGALCGVAGYTIARLGQRRAGGGKTAAELKQELGDYKENVAEHFQATAGLLHEMTEQYRAVYEHMATGAQQLCDPELAALQIESLRAGLLPAAVPEAANTGDEPISDHLNSEMPVNDMAHEGSEPSDPDDEFELPQQSQNIDAPESPITDSDDAGGSSDPVGTSPVEDATAHAR